MKNMDMRQGYYPVTGLHHWMVGVKLTKTEILGEKEASRWHEVGFVHIVNVTWASCFSFFPKRDVQGAGGKLRRKIGVGRKV